METGKESEQPLNFIANILPISIWISNTWDKEVYSPHIWFDDTLIFMHMFIWCGMNICISL